MEIIGNKEFILNTEKALKLIKKDSNKKWSEHLTQEFIKVVKEDLCE